LISSGNFWDGLISSENSWNGLISGRRYANI